MGRPMVRKRMMAVVVAAGSTLALAGCGSHSPKSSSSTTTTTTTAVIAATTTSRPHRVKTTRVHRTTTTVGPTTTVSTQPAQNLILTPTVRTQLIAAGAALNKLPASDYTGLVSGTAYYGFDPGTATYWAAAGLVPSPSSTQAQVAAQDDGSYLLFSRPTTGAWTAVDDGVAGAAGSACPAPIPASIVKVWDWAPGACRPPA
jgi:hypothetical protein